MGYYGNCLERYRFKECKIKTRVQAQEIHIHVWSRGCTSESFTEWNIKWFYNILIQKKQYRCHTNCSCRIETLWKHTVPVTDCKCIVILGKQCEYCINMLISLYFCVVCGNMATTICSPCTLPVLFMLSVLGKQTHLVISQNPFVLAMVSDIVCLCVVT